MEPFSILLGLCASQAFDVAKDVAKDIGEDFIGDKVKDFASSLKKRLKSDLSLPQTQILLRQIRTAELAAARYLEQAYRSWLKPLPDYMKTNGQLDFANKLKNFLNDALKPNASGQISLRIPGEDQINQILDEMVAAVMAEAAPNGAPSTRQILETAFLAEIRTETGCKIPIDFQEFFTGAEPAANGGWYNIVALNISDAIANNERFRALFFAADLAETRRLAAAASTRAQRLLDEGIPSIRDDIAHLTAAVSEVHQDIKSNRATTEQIVALLQGSNLFQRAAADGISEAAVRRIAERLKLQGARTEDLIPLLENWIEAAVIELGRKSNEGDAYEAADREAQRRFQAGRIDDASAAFMEELDRREQHEAERQQEYKRSQIELLRRAIRYDALALKEPAIVQELRMMATYEGIEGTDALGKWLFAEAYEFQEIGNTKGSNPDLFIAIAAYRTALEEYTQDRVPLDWAATQNNLGEALRTLGEREAGTARLEEAVAAFRAALRERTQDRVPLAWAATQNNLGNALKTLGEREAGTARLEEALAAYRAALREYTQDRVPLEWAVVQNNLGNALKTLGEREAGTVRLEEAVAAYREALQERTRDRVPLDWALTQNNLGTALFRLGERESGAARFEEAVQAYRAALEDRTRDRVPLYWAQTQNNLGNALSRLGERESGTARLEEAVKAYRAALEEWTRDRVPLNWAATQNNLGGALLILGERESGTALLEEAVAAGRAALHERTEDRVPLYWAESQHTLANALAALAGRQKSAPQMAEALACMKNAVDGYTQCGANYWLPIAQARVTEIESALAALQS